ncbi:MAG: decaprenyl-phosphate phosphoribosyltransferase [Acidimicrobiales bacterium]
MVRTFPDEPPPDLEPQAETSPRDRRLVPGLLRIARPKQWIKNVLVFAAPGAAGVLTHGRPFLFSLAAFAIFCLAASGTYFVNDALDAEADRHHPVKRLRPVAAGVVPVNTAVGSGLALMALSVGLAWWLAGGKLALVIALYVALSTAYSLRLKHEPILDLAGLSSGFILRAIAGGVATGIALSDWFLIVTCFGSLLIATGKRSAEHLHLGEARARFRPVLADYPPVFLRSVRLLAAAVTITAYCLWAFERSTAFGGRHHPIWFELSIVPVVLVLLHLELRFERGGGVAPEELALHDRMLQVLGIVWIALFAIGVYS